MDFESEDGVITISVNPTDENKLKDTIESIIPDIDYLYDEVGMFAKEKVTLEGEDKVKEARTSYEALSEEGKVLFLPDSYLFCDCGCVPLS